jgi:uncharacterized GH25 family protein
MKTRIIAGIVSLLLAALPGAAHDYWLVPDAFFVKPGDETALHLHVGDDFVSEKERPFQKTPIVRFNLVHGKETMDLIPLGVEDKTPFAKVALKKAGTYLVRMDRSPQKIELDPEKFNKYLADEGLDAILEQRKKLGEDKQPGRERYSRCLKSLLQCGDERDATATAAVGQTLEIIPLDNPYSLKGGDTLKVRVLFDGKPLKGAKVFAHRRAGDKVTTQAATSDADGTAAFKLDGEGSYLVRLVHMRRCAGVEGVDWESFWAALTFGMK